MLIQRTFIFVTLLAAIAFCAPRAHAQVPVAVDIDYALPVEAPGVSDGFGGQLRFGPMMDLGLLRLTSEIGLGVHDFSGPVGPTMFRGVIGTRLGLGVLIRPTVFAHIGAGHANFDQTEDLTHVTLDLGGALDFTVAPGLELGAHAAYNFLFGNGTVGSFGYLALGGHITVILGHRGADGGDGGDDHHHHD